MYGTWCGTSGHTRPGLQGKARMHGMPEMASKSVSIAANVVLPGAHVVKVLKLGINVCHGVFTLVWSMHPYS